MQSGTFNILVGIDFSDSCAGAMYHALALAERLKAVLHLCHISPHHANLTVPTDLGLNVPPEFKDALEARKRLERMRAMLGSTVDVNLHLRMGDPVRGLLDLAAELRPDMLVVGSHGFGAVMRMFMGSVSTQLTRLSPVPVLVVPAPGREEAARQQDQDAKSPDPALPAVGVGTDAELDVARTNDSASGSVNVNPPGTSGADVNPELRVRY